MMKKTIKFTAAVAMIGLMAFASAGCGGDDKKAAAAKDNLALLILPTVWNQQITTLAGLLCVTA
jgi:hypothetical protein